jgi:hypothetical protein
MFMTKEPTNRQSQCLKAIYDFWKSRGYYPTVRDICGILGLSSTKSATDLMLPLRARGLLSNKTNRVRGVELTREAFVFIKNHDWPKAKQLPLFGRVQNSVATISGTAYIYEYNFETDFSHNIKSGGVIFDTDGVITVTGEANTIFYPDDNKTKKYITTTTANEFRQKEENLPSNATIIESPHYFNSSCTAYDSLESEILLVWHSTSSYFTFRHKNTVIGWKDLKFWTDGNQLKLALPGIISCDGSLLSFFNKSIGRIAQFCDFPISGAIMNKAGEIFVCSSHTAHKKADFDNFTKAVEKKYAVVSGGDKIFIRDVRFNGLPLFHVKKFKINSTLYDGRSQNESRN